MKAVRLIAGSGMLAALASCASRPEAPPPPPPPRPAPVILAPRPPSPPPPALAWEDMALTPGSWRYGAGASGPVATYGSASGASFSIRCSPARQILVTREGAGPDRQMTIRTSSTARSFEGNDASLAPSDPILDAIAFSRGRFSVDSPGLPLLIIPAWPEPARVIEDCRR